MLILSLLFLAEIPLPLWETKAAVKSTYRPATHSRHGHTSYSEDNVVIVTARGNVKVPVTNLNGVWPGDSVTVHRTALLLIPKKIYLHRQDHLVSSSNVLYSWFIFLPMVTLILSAVTLRISDKDTLMNIGSGSLILGIFTLALLLMD